MNEFIKELNKIIAEEVKRVKLEELRPDDWTIERMRKEFALTVPQARRVLSKLTEQGHFYKVSIPNPKGGGARTAYRPVGKK